MMYCKVLGRFFRGCTSGKKGKLSVSVPEQDADGVGSTQQLVKVASDALEEAGFSRLGGESFHD